MFGNHGLGGLLEEGGHGKSPKCLGGNLGDFGEFCKGLSYDPETDPLLKIPPEPQGPSEAQPELVYYQLDHLGTPIAAHNAKGEAVWTAEYEAWGRIRNEIVQPASKSTFCSVS